MTFFESLLLAHFIGDWLLQPHAMAIKKTSDPLVRTVHCLIVAWCFIPVLPPGVLGSWAVLWIYTSHWIIDTYKPLYWFRWLRGDFKNQEEFKASFSTPAGFMVNIVFDQLFHILCLVPIVWWNK